jgi:tRNA-Thr(GGU) m(6)t(6)A37 methyltransferase TsaA
MADQITYRPIGIFRSNKKSPSEAARQPAFDISPADAYIELFPGNNFEQALQDLKSFSHIWVLFHFHKNESWKPIVLPPVGEKKGLFATRSPYRPNGIGMSAVQLQYVQDLRIFISQHDILDGSPVLDIKPYVPEYDQITGASSGWLDEARGIKFSIQLSELAKSQLAHLIEAGLVNLENVIINQLQNEPTNRKKKRVRQAVDSTTWILSYRTWRIGFKVDPNIKIVEVEKIFSAYSRSELNETLDPYGDKAIHRSFNLKNPDSI